MALPVVYRQAARLEILSAARLYEAQRRELGRLFLDEIARIETHMSDAPRLYRRDPEAIASTMTARRHP